jgi:hypothetical protein
VSSFLVKRVHWQSIKDGLGWMVEEARRQLVFVQIFMITSKIQGHSQGHDPVGGQELTYTRTHAAMTFSIISDL